jgi:hypothetical protein
VSFPFRALVEGHKQADYLLLTENQEPPSFIGTVPGFYVSRLALLRGHDQDGFISIPFA